jgi:hypothetical protein
MVLANNACPVALLLEQPGQCHVVGKNLRVPSNHGLSMSLSRSEEIHTHAPAGVATSQAVEPAGRTDGRNNMLAHQQRPFGGKSIYIGAQIPAFALSKTIEHVLFHIVGDNKDNVRPAPRFASGSPR